MLRLIQLSSEPECFSPIKFHSGVNLILGERSDQRDAQGRKVNGVGKSICIEFLHFALCRAFAETRLSKIPEGVLPDSLVVILDLSIGTKRLQIRRAIANTEQPTIIGDDSEAMVCETLVDATDYLGSLLFAGHEYAGQVSFRQIMSLLMRDEQSEFKTYINPHDTSRRIPDDISPHLYLLGIDLTAYHRFQHTVDRLDSQTKILRELKLAVTNGNELKISDIPSKLNEERKTTQRIEEALSAFRADPAFEEVEGEFARIEIELQDLRAARQALSFQIDQIRSIPLPERIDATDLKIVYDRIKSGLGSLVEKSFEQAKLFKAEIERFQHGLRQEELTSLESQRRELNFRIRKLSDNHSELTRQMDRKGVLAELKIGLEVATRRTDEYHRLVSQFKLYEAKQREVSDTRAERTTDLNAIAHTLDANRAVEQSLNDTIVAIHEKIMLSSFASFRFSLKYGTATKQPLTYEIRIQDDGSHSVNRSRVFIYDMALLFDPLASQNHPGFLVHDGIAEVDQDTLTRCLNFLHAQSDSNDDFQYIMTLNRDRIESEEKRHEILLDIDKAKCAAFTKANRFLKCQYQET